MDTNNIKDILAKGKPIIEAIDKVVDIINQEIRRSSEYTMFIWLGIFVAGVIAGLLV